MKEFQLWTYLMHSDLHCMSAFEMIRSGMGHQELTRLRRFGVWHLTFESDEDQRSTISTMIDQSYYLVNPNKEAYFLDGIPAKDSIDLSRRLNLKVSPKHQSSNESLVARLRDRFKVDLLTATRSLVWEMQLSEPSDSLTIQKTFMSAVSGSVSRTKGFLVQPLFETYEWLDVDQVYTGIS